MRNQEFDLVSTMRGGHLSVKPDFGATTSRNLKVDACFVTLESMHEYAAAVMVASSFGHHEFEPTERFETIFFPLAIHFFAAHDATYAEKLIRAKIKEM